MLNFETSHHCIVAMSLLHIMGMMSTTYSHMVQKKNNALNIQRRMKKQEAEGNGREKRDKEQMETEWKNAGQGEGRDGEGTVAGEREGKQRGGQGGEGTETS